MSFKALAGDVRAIQVIAERVEGKLMQQEDSDLAPKEMKVVIEYIGRSTESGS